MSLTEVLPTDPVIPTTGQPSSRRQARARPWRPASGSSAASTQAAVARRSVGPGQRARPFRLHHHPPGARLDRRRRELASLGALAREGRRTGRRAAPARESATARSGRPPPPATDHLGAGRGRDPIGGELDQASDPPRSASQLLAGDLAIVEGDLSAAGELLALLVPLAGDHDRVARGRPRRAPARSPRAGPARPAAPSGRARGSRRGSRR